MKEPCCLHNMQGFQCDCGERNKELSLLEKVVKLEKALADTEALWRQERARVRELEAQRDEIMTAIERFTKGGER